MKRIQLTFKSVMTENNCSQDWNEMLFLFLNVFEQPQRFLVMSKKKMKLKCHQTKKENRKGVSSCNSVPYIAFI